jgi:iron complex transport system substrate-binding protein
MRRIFLWGVLAAIVSLPAAARGGGGSAGGTHVPADQEAAITVTDFEGRTVSITPRPERIISLAPISTRVIAQYGLLDKVIGVDQKSFDMDLLPKPLSERGLSITNLGNAKSVNEEAVLRLRPDIIITQYDKAQADLLSGRIGVPVLCIQNRGGVNMDYELFEILGKTLSAETRSNEIIEYMKAMVTKTENIARNNQGANHPLVYVATDSSLLNTFPQDYTIQLCGGRNAAAEITAMNYWGGAAVDAEFLIRAKPDIMIVWIAFTAPWKVEEFRKSLAKPEYADIPAIKNSRVYSFLSGDGKDYFYTMAAISETLHNFYPGNYTRQMLEEDIKAHLALFYPAVSYTEYKQIRGKVTIDE